MFNWLAGSAIISGQTTTIDAVTAATNGNAGILRPFRKAPVAWIAAGVEVYSDGTKVFSEDYSDIRPNVKLDADTFDPKKFATTHWEK